MVHAIAVEPEVGATVTADSGIVAWMLGAFVVTFLVTRAITHLIRAGRGPFRDTTVGGVHIHHQVYGIFLILCSGTVAIVYQPDSPWQEVVATLFGMGAALTLDEFALWLRLDDVYWGPEGRRSVDAVLVAVAIGLMMLLGLNPFDTDASGGVLVLAISVCLSLFFVVVAILKGRSVLGVLGLFFLPLAIVAALRLAKPRSPWGRRFYRPTSRSFARAQRRYPPNRRARWDPLVDLLAGRPTTAHEQPAAIDPAPSDPAPRDHELGDRTSPDLTKRGSAAVDPASFDAATRDAAARGSDSPDTTSRDPGARDPASLDRAADSG